MTWYAYRRPKNAFGGSMCPYWMAVNPPRAALPDDALFWAPEKEDVQKWINERIELDKVAKRKRRLNLRQLDLFPKEEME